MIQAPLLVTFVYGTRPEAIKMAPLVRAVGAHPELAARVLVTGQHREMLDQVHEVFQIRPDADLDLMRPNQTLSDITTRVLEGVSHELRERPPALLVVQGDTTTAMAAALASFYARVPLAHLEAGLRSGDKEAPFPEEVNRRLVSVLADLHLAPTQGNREELLREGVPAASIVVTGNTVIDALTMTLRGESGFADRRVESALDGAQRSGQRVVTVTCHRRESWGAVMRSINVALNTLVDLFPDVVWVVPAHKNPRVRADLLTGLEARANVVVCEPLAYPEFCLLLARSTLVLTDSGGVQEEAPSLGVPVLVLRSVTERPEAVAAGAVRLVGTQEAGIVDHVSRLLRSAGDYAAMAHAVNPYGDGRAAERSVGAISQLLGVGQRLPDFDPLALPTAVSG